MTDASDKREQFIAGLRELADLLEGKPVVPIPTGDLKIYGYFDGSLEAVADIARALGHCEKVVRDGDFHLTKNFGAVTYSIFTPRENICERKVTGKREVTRKISDPDAPLVEVTEEVEDVEWVCPDSLLAGSKEVSA